MSKVVTFGEVLMRLSPSDSKMLRQSREMEFFFGGTEMNVGASFHYGMRNETHNQCFRLFHRRISHCNNEKLRD